jgi:transcriptional regulator with XRE-family HTH domain
MRNIELGKVGKKIRQIRKERSLNLQEVADRSDITAGLLSRIENFRTLPSLPVLHNISIALGVPLSELVGTVGHNGEQAPYLLIKDGEGELRSNLGIRGLMQESLLETAIDEHNLQVSMLKLHPGAAQPQTTFEGSELLFVVKGNLSFEIQQESIPLKTGDTLFYNARNPHAMLNTNGETAVLFRVCWLGKKAQG